MNKKKIKAFIINDIVPPYKYDCLGVELEFKKINTGCKGCPFLSISNKSSICYQFYKGKEFTNIFKKNL